MITYLELDYMVDFFFFKKREAETASEEFKNEMSLCGNYLSHCIHGLKEFKVA